MPATQQIQKMVTNELMNGAVYGVVGGVIAIFMSMILSPLAAAFGAASNIVVLLIGMLLLIIGLVYGGKAGSMLRKMSFVGWVLLLVSITIVGSIVALFIPGIEQYILTVNGGFDNLSGLVFTLAYVSWGAMIATKLKYKPK